MQHAFIPMGLLPHFKKIILTSKYNDHLGALMDLGYMHPLEVSTKSNLALGKGLSAFNLKLRVGNSIFPVENWYQASKRFINGTGDTDFLLHVSPSEAKARNKPFAGTLSGFYFDKKEYPLDDDASFYDLLYHAALEQLPEETKRLIEKHDVFIDSFFSVKRGHANQARSLAKWIGKNNS